MRQCGLFLMALAVAVMCVPTSQAAVQLLSDYTFDDATGGQAVAGASGGYLVGGATIGTGGVGAGVLSTVAVGDAFVQNAPFPAPGSLAAVGTESIWFKGIANTGSGVLMMYCASNGSGVVNHGVYGLFGDGTLCWYQKAADDPANPISPGDPDQEMYISIVNPSWIGGTDWHNLTVTYNLNGNPGSTAAFYLDGVLKTTTVDGGIDSDLGGLGAYTQAGLGVGSTGAPNYGQSGSRDDFATWGTELDGTQVAALYNLGLTGVLDAKYNAMDASALFDAFSTASNTSTSDGRAWTYVASGLAGAAGSVGSNYVVLDGNGGGMSTIPEPGTLALLAAGLVGLLAYAWRRRK